MAADRRLAGVWLMLDAMTAMPSAARLESARLLAIPTVRTFLAAAAFSGIELAVILAVLWPWRAEYYVARLAMAVLALVTWLVVMTPLDLTRMDRVHRRWLAVMTLVLAGALLTVLVYRAVRRVTRGADA